MFPREGTTIHDWWYCLGCGKGDYSQYVTKSHVRTCQPEEPVEEGVTHAQGWQVEQMRERFLQEAGPRITVFITALRQDNYCAEDFLIDCGHRFL